jgi:hypothetical protein
MGPRWISTAQEKALKEGVSRGNGARHRCRHRSDAAVLLSDARDRGIDAALQVLGAAEAASQTAPEEERRAGVQGREAQGWRPGTAPPTPSGRPRSA